MKQIINSSYKVILFWHNILCEHIQYSLLTTISGLEWFATAWIVQSQLNLPWINKLGKHNQHMVLAVRDQASDLKSINLAMHIFYSVFIS